MNIRMAIAGASFREHGTAIVATLQPYQKYRLEREPSNPYDPNAVKILVDDFCYGRLSARTYNLGYIPQKWSGTVSAALKNNRLHVWAYKPDTLWGSIEVKWVDLADDPL